jgi:two-component system chemotaxis sensor kinase CheA
VTSSEDDFLARLRATFTIEAGEHLHAMATGLLALEKSPDPDAQVRLVEIIFRAAHSLKGAARAVDFTDIETRCQSLEDMFAAWKHQTSSPTREVLDAAHRTLDAIGAAIGMPAWRTPLGEADGVPAVPAAAAPAIAPDDTVRISVTKLDQRVLRAEEMLIAKLTAAQHADDLRALATRFGAWNKAWASVEPAVRVLPSTRDQHVVEFLEWNRDYVKSLEGSVAVLIHRAVQDRDAIGKLVDDVLEDSKKLLLLPFAAFVAPFPKLVRDLCRDQGKEADLILQGEEVETDKRILEEMKAPLIHLLRNCVDHGIELPDERRRRGKPLRGTITLTASAVNGNKVQIRVSDDGAGIDAEKVKMSAIAHGVRSADEARELGDVEAVRLIFEPEVTTSPSVTKVSGRGLGLAIVREKAEKLGGTVSVETQPGRRTEFSIVLPSTLATFRGVLIEAAQQVFVVPTLHVERVTRVKADDIRSVEGRDTVTVNGLAVPLVRLADVLELADAKADADPRADTQILVLGAGDQRVAFAVDVALDEQEVLVKPLRKPLSRVRNVSGATVLGSGQVAPILNVSDLLKSAKRSSRAVARSGAAVRPTPAEVKSLLVVEDSITSRMLIKGILESAGYTVKTAVDGLEAFTMLRAERFDLVVSDVEMPRLDGFGLTARLRADKTLAAVPVVLVTALEKREDRERGIDVGANAYIVKSRFDQSDLLDAVRRLV